MGRDANIPARDLAPNRRTQTELILRGDLDEGNLEALLAELAELGEPVSGLDLGDLTMVEPPTLAVLAASLRDLLRRGVCDAELLEAGGGNGCIGPEDFSALVRVEGGSWRGLGNGGIVGWREFASDDGIWTASSEVARHLQEAGWPRRSCTAFAGIAFEMAQNVRQHSGAPGGALSLQIDPNDERVKLAVADRGVGILASVTRNPEFEDIDDDLSAIENAVRAGKSGEPGGGGGMGLYLARVLVRHNGGRLMVRSGDARWQEAADRSRERRLASYGGTLIAIEASTHPPFEDEEIRGHIAAL